MKVSLWIKISVVLALVTTLVTYSLNWYDNQIDIAQTAAANTVRNEYSAQVINLLEERRKLEANLVKQKETSDAKSKEEISRLSARIKSLNARLSDFASKPAGSDPGNTNRAVAEIGRTPEGETRILYREAIGNLISEAQRADEVSIALQGCYRDYNAARDTLSIQTK